MNTGTLAEIVEELKKELQYRNLSLHEEGGFLEVERRKIVI